MGKGCDNEEEIVMDTLLLHIYPTGYQLSCYKMNFSLSSLVSHMLISMCT